MRRSLLLAVGAVVATVTLPLGASGALLADGASPADDTYCTGALTGSHDNVIVPAGESCDIEDASITGNIKVYGSLEVDGTPVRGNIDAEPGHGYVRIGFSSAEPMTVGGSVQIKGSTAEGQKSGYGSGLELIRGNFQFEANESTLVAAGSSILGNLKAIGNSGGGSITKNEIRGNLECSGNDPEITETSNTVHGNDLCPPLAGAPGARLTTSHDN
jgi:hypothetical protein